MRQGLHLGSLLFGGTQQARARALPQQQHSAQVLDHFSPKLARVCPVANRAVDEIQAACQIRIDQLGRQFGGCFAGDSAHNQLSLVKRNLSAVARQLIQEANGVAHGTGAVVGDKVQGLSLHRNPFLPGDVCESIHDRLHRNPPEIKALAARGNRCRDLVRICGDQGKDHVRRWLFQGLEQGIEGRLGEHVCFIQHVDFVLSFARPEAHLLADIADLVDAPIAGGIDLDQVQQTPLVDGYTDRTAIAGPLADRRLTIDRLGQQAGCCRLARAARPGEEIGLPEFGMPQRILKGARYGLLSYHILECLRAILEIERLGGHRFSSAGRLPPPATSQVRSWH